MIPLLSLYFDVNTMCFYCYISVVQLEIWGGDASNFFMDISIFQWEVLGPLKLELQRVVGCMWVPGVEFGSF